jgi:phenylacetate-coenzyme A ligase PaaK-like adenylate-forming protein
MLPPFDPLYTGRVTADVLLASQADEAGLAQRRESRLRALLSAASEGSPRYRKVLEGRRLDTLRLEDLPIAHKRDLMQDFAEWVCDPALSLEALRRFTADPALIATPFLGRYTVWESSGTSGEPAVFVQDAHAMAVYDALEAVRRPLLRPDRAFLDPLGLGERIAFVGATGGHFASTVSVERLRSLNPMARSQLHGLSFLQPMKALTAQLEACRPTVLATYPSAAVILAEEHGAGRLHIAPSEIWTGGENLTPAMRQFIERSFGCRVANSYGASEFLAIGSECREGRLHVNSDWVILESVDAHGRPAPADEAGATTLLTNLANHVQPLIRYDLGDRITLHAQPCACGSRLPVIEVQGRDDDMLWLGDRAVPIGPLALSTVLEEEAGLFDFHLEQQSPRRLLLTTGMAGADADRLLRKGRAALARFLDLQGIGGTLIRCRSGVQRPCGRSGKHARITGIARPPR